MGYFEERAVIEALALRKTYHSLQGHLFPSAVVRGFIVTTAACPQRVVRGRQFQRSQA